MRGKHKRMDYQEGSLPPSISTPRRESGSLCPYVGCVDSHTVVSLQEPRMFLRDEAHKSSPTECSPVHVVSPSPVSWVPEVHPSSEKTASEKSGILCSLEGPLETPLHLVECKRDSSRVEAGISVFLSISDSDRKVPACWYRRVRPRLFWRMGLLLPLELFSR